MRPVRGAELGLLVERGKTVMGNGRRSMARIVLGLQLLAGVCQGSAFTANTGTTVHGSGGGARRSDGKAAALGAKTSSLLSSAAGVRGFFAARRGGSNSVGGLAQPASASSGSATRRRRRLGRGGASMFNTRGGGGASSPGMRGGGEGVTTSPAGDASAAAGAAVPQGSGEGGAGAGTGGAAAPVLDLIQPHSVSAEEVAGFYGCTMGQGLTAAEVRNRVAIYGPNSLKEPDKQSLFSMIVEQFEDRLVQILLAVAVLSGVLSAFENDLHAFVEPASILAILVLNAAVGVWQSRSAQDSLDALKQLQPDNACVVRDGELIGALPAAELVPGDLMYLRVGDKVAADARLVSLKTTTFGCEEGSLTGESVAVFKSTDPVAADSTIAAKRNMVFSGTMITGGQAWAVVTATGMRTEIGKISAGVQEAKEDAEKTPLQCKLDEFGDTLTWIIGVICVAVWCISIPRFDDPMFGAYWKGAVYYAKVAVALGVAAIPEGLPAVITLCLSLGTRRMAQRNVIVRKLPSVETLGCTTVICTDKTGTLTTNQMTAVSLVTVGVDGDGQPHLAEMSAEGVSYEPVGVVEGLADDAMEHGGMRDLASICAVCNDAQIVFDAEEGTYGRIGEPTEAALSVLVEKLGVPGVSRSGDKSVAASQFCSFWVAKYDKLATLEFNRNRKSMSVLCRARGDEPHNRLFVKGAPEMLVKRCSKVMMPDGRSVPMTDQFREEIIAKYATMAVRPLRCLALATKDGDDLGSLNSFREGDDPQENDDLKNADKFEELESGLTFVGICGIKDPARPEVADAMKLCQDAGVRVMVITGDSKDTATAIARDVNIFGPEEDVVDRAWVGAEFFRLPEEKQKGLLATGNMLFCRTEPKDKQRLVKMLQEMGEVPAMTGDGVNDAPALQQAAIGIAMGIAGTEVSKDAADMVLADDNFATIVSAVEEGRAIYNNMQAFICFLISCNIGEIATIFFATLLGLPEPLTPLHLLWVNLVTDGPPATALGFNPPDPDAMSKPPRPKDEPIMSKWLLTRYLLTGLYVGFATLGVSVHWYLDHGVSWSQLINWSTCIGEGMELPAAAGLEYLASKPCEIFTTAKAIPQSLALSTLVTMEMLKALSAVSVDNSMLRVPPWRNRWLLAGVAFPSLLHLAVLYLPGVGETFGVAPLTWDDWTWVLRFSLPILLVEEVLKAVGRKVNEKKATEQRASTQKALEDGHDAWRTPAA